MWNRTLASLLAFVLLAPALLADPPSSHIPPGSLPDPSTPAGWLFANAHVLHQTKHIPATHDLEPLLALAGDATVVGLGDGTHGTHEFSTVKLRIIDFLVREKDFDVIALEAAFPVMNRVNEYVQGGAGDPRAILGDAATRLGYYFWATEEMVEVIEWMREYNARRGDRPAIEIVGVDAADDRTLAADVVAYLRTVDPAYAAQAESVYACVSAPRPTGACRAAVPAVYETLAGRETGYVAASSPRAYHDALYAASIIFAASRDETMAGGTLWARQHRGSSGKVFFWAHNEHVDQNNSTTDAGRILHFALGDGYFTIATMSGPGSFMGWQFNPVTRLRDAVVQELLPVEPGSYEAYFAQRGARALLIPVRGNVPDWLRGPATYRAGSSDGSAAPIPLELPLHHDAVVYVDRTTPVTSILP